MSNVASVIPFVLHMLSSLSHCPMRGSVEKMCDDGRLRKIVYGFKF